VLAGFLSSVPYWIWSLLTVAAIIHYFRTRPDGYWIWIVIFLGPLGAIAYFVVNVILPLTGGGGAALEGKVSLTLDERRRVRELEHKIEDNPLPYDYAQLGELLYKRGDYAKAEPILRQAVAKIDDEIEPQYWLALTLDRLGKAADAARLLAPIVRRDARYKFGEAYLAYARALEHAGQRDQAREAYKQVLGQSTFTEARVRYGLLLAAAGDATAAREQLQTAVREGRDLPRHNLRAARPFLRAARQWLRAN